MPVPTLKVPAQIRNLIRRLHPQHLADVQYRLILLPTSTATLAATDILFTSFA